MAKLLGISGSLRKDSVNTALLRAAAEFLPEGSALDIRSLAEIPLFDQDLLDAEGSPAAVVELKEALAAADGLLIMSPEYNHGPPGVLKNAIDWASRPAADIPKVFGGLPVAVGGAGGISGTRFGQTALMPTIRVLGMRPWYGSALFLTGVRDVFDESGEFVDPETAERVRRFTLGFAEHCASLPRER